MGQSPACLASKRNHRMKFSQLLAASCLLVLSSSAPQRRRNQNVNTKFFTGNNAIDSAAWGAAIGAGTQYLANQVCRGGNRGGTRGGNKGTTTRLATVSSASSEVSELQQSLTGFLETRVDKEIVIIFSSATRIEPQSLLGNLCG